MSTYLWQNFLKDTQMIRTIATAITHLYQKSWAQALIEIGPGKGAITKKIHQISNCFFVVEKDLRMQEPLQALGLSEQQIIFWDVLEQYLTELLKERGLQAENAIVVGNLPYYITSPIFKHLFWKEDPDFLWGFFMVQDEVWQKIKSNAGKKSYLWWLINRGYRVEYVKMVPAKCFSPAPKVKSCLLRFIKKEKTESVAYSALEAFLNIFSPYSRKTLGKIAKMQEKKGKSTYQIPLELQGKRLEELCWKDLEKILRSNEFWLFK